MKQLNPFTVPICFLSQQKIDAFYYIAKHRYASLEDIMQHLSYQKPFVSTILSDLRSNGFANCNKRGKRLDYYLTPLGTKLHSVFLQLETQGSGVIDFFSIVATANRMQMVKYLFLHGTATTQELAFLTKVTQAAVSIFLRKCEKSGLVYRDDKKSSIGFYPAQKYMPLLSFMFS
jgi:DNA-binding MarR family transcriptional regulator